MVWRRGHPADHWRPMVCAPIATIIHGAAPSGQGHAAAQSATAGAPRVPDSRRELAWPAMMPLHNGHFEVASSWTEAPLDQCFLPFHG